MISRHGIQVSTLRGAAAKRFMSRINTGDNQQLMARVTGNYKRGNERRQ